MSIIRKTNNEDSLNPNTIGTISKKSSYRQMTKPLLNNKVNNTIPRLNELLNDEIFQYYFRTHFNSKEYSKFKYYSENEKLNIMIDLYFYIMNKNNNNYIEEEQINEYNNNYDMDNDNDNIIDKLLDNLLVLDYNQSRLNVIDKMKQYKLFSLNNENNYNDKFNKIINKYKNEINNDNEETVNYYYNKTDKNLNNNLNNNNINDINNINNNKVNSYTNFNYNSKPLSTTKFNVRTMSNNNTDSGIKYKTQSNLMIYEPNYMNEELKINNDNNIYNEIIGPYIKNNIYDKINLLNIKMIKLGKIRKKKINLEENNNENNNYIEYLLNPIEFEIKSKKNDIEEKEIKNYIYNNKYNTPVNYKILKPNINSKIKNNISPIIYNDNNNEIIIQEPLIICQSNIENIKMNLLLKKQCNEGETNELIKKIYQYEEDNILFNKNEINKIGILLLNYIKLEKKFNILEANLFLYKEKLSKMKEIMKIFTQKSMERINDSNNFIKELKIN